MRTFNRKNLKSRRKDLRNNPTQAEAFLWGYLKGNKLAGKKFRRQASIKSFIVDFHCPEEKLVIELDGDSHFDDEVKKYDEERTKILEEEGLKVIRFENQEVLLNLDRVLSEIKKNFQQKQENIHPLLSERGCVKMCSRNLYGCEYLIKTQT